MWRTRGSSSLECAPTSASRDRDVVSVYPPIVDQITTFFLRRGMRFGGLCVEGHDRLLADVLAPTLGLKKPRVAETGGASYAMDRQQWG